MPDIVTKGLKDAFSNMARFSIRLALIPLFIIYLFTGFYSIPQDKVGVVQRFGKIIEQRVQPGLHYAFPWPIDKIDKVPVKLIKSILIDDFSQDYEFDSLTALFEKVTGLSPYCISGDNNIVSVSLMIKYNIIDPVAYLFKIKNNEQVFRDLACSTIIHCLATLPVDEMLTYGKKGIEDYVRTNLQRKLDNLQAGLGVSFIELKEVNPPRSVQKFFDDVINAKIDKRKMINKAESDRNMRIPKAKARADRMIQEATAYKREKISYAEGETKRFLAQLAEYSGSKKVTRRRLYLEFIRSTYPSLKNIIVVDNKKGKKLINIKVFSK